MFVYAFLKCDKNKIILIYECSFMQAGNVICFPEGRKKNLYSNNKK
jgi:hypothetical protein